MLGVHGPVTPLLRRVANWSCKIQADSGPRPKKHGGVIGQKGHVTVTSSVQMKIHGKSSHITEIGMTFPWED